MEGGKQKVYIKGLLDATAQGLKRGTIAITGAQRYAPMLDHLLPREAFLDRYADHARRLGLPAQLNQRPHCNYMSGHDELCFHIKMSPTAKFGAADCELALLIGNEFYGDRLALWQDPIDVQLFNAETMRPISGGNL